MIEALIFDFDGLILETESPDYQSWQEIYRAHSCPLPMSEWAKWVGSTDGFDPYGYLEQQLGRPVDRAAIRARRHARLDQLMAGQSVLPGVLDYIRDATGMRLKLGVASSSPQSWVLGHLERLGLDTCFDSIHCGDQVERTKPDPAVYLAVLRALDVGAQRAIALEDSPNGVLAAKRAGIYCVAVPNPLTRQLVLDRADIQLDSLAELSLEELLARVPGT